MIIKALEILLNLGIVSIFVTGLVWLSREIFKQILNRDLEKFKLNLEKEAIEFKIRYERIHGERVEVIKEVYKKMSNTYDSFFSLMNFIQSSEEPPQEEKGKEAAEIANDLIKYYSQNKIFFSEELAKDIDNFLDELKKSWVEFLISVINKNIKEYKESLRYHSSAWKKIEKDIPEIKKQLERKFRDIIGI